MDLKEIVKADLLAHLVVIGADVADALFQRDIDGVHRGLASVFILDLIVGNDLGFLDMRIAFQLVNGGIRHIIHLDVIGAHIALSRSHAARECGEAGHEHRHHGKRCDDAANCQQRVPLLRFDIAAGKQRFKLHVALLMLPLPLPVCSWCR